MFTYTLYVVTICLSAAFASKSKDCDPYPHVELEHGDIRRAGPTKYTFHCDEGYYVSGHNYVRCFRGNWTSLREPKCSKIQGLCEEPPDVDNAIIHGKERHEGATVKYICKEGFTLVGHSELSCTNTRYWNRRPPSCMDQSEPLQTVAERLNNSFVTSVANYSVDTPEGRLMDSKSLQLGLELYILIDRSSSVDPVDLERSKDFTKYLLQRFVVKNNEVGNGTRASVITFGQEVQRVFGLDNKNISSSARAGAAVDTIQPNGGGTNLHGALTLVWFDADDKLMREKAKRALFLMTDGEPTIVDAGSTPQDVAKELRNSYNFEIFTVGIGKGINMRLLGELASEPALSHVFMLDKYTDLNEVMQVIQSVKPPAPKISKDQCGYIGPKEHHPWMATLYIQGSPFKVCSGVLICSHWVLTAASCLQEGPEPVKKKDVFVVLGQRSFVKRARHQTNYYVVDMRIHPNYDPEKLIFNDLALLELYLPKDHERKYRPACLPLTDGGIPMHLNLKINASIAGFGTTSAAKITHARADDLQLFKMFETSVSLSEELECPIRRPGLTQLCAGLGSKTCHGLLGSPLIAVDSATGFRHILGILADRTRCARGQNQYVELTKHVNWINHVTHNCQLKHWGLSE